MLLFILGAALQLVAATCMGIFLATIAGSMPQFGLLLMLVLLPLQILSGGMTPRESMPEVIQWIMTLAPNTHFVILAQAVLFRDAASQWFGRSFWRSWPSRSCFSGCPCVGSATSCAEPPVTFAG